MRGCPIFPPSTKVTIHTYTAYMGYGGSFNTLNHRVGVPGMWVSEGCGVGAIVTYRSRCELSSIRLVLCANLGDRVKSKWYTKVNLNIYNQAVVHIKNSMVSDRKDIISLLR